MRIVKILAFFLATLIILSQNIWASDMDALLNLPQDKKSKSAEDVPSFRDDLAVKKLEEKSKKKSFEVIASELIKLSGYTQVRYRIRDDNNDTFDIRRSRLTLKSDISQRFSYKLQCEFGGSRQKLLDAELGYKFNPNFKLTAGQFKIPFSQENLTSSARLDTINRSQVVEALTARSKDVLGNQNGRDIGVKISGSFWQASNNYLFDYAFGVFNGSGTNTPDYNEQKDFIGRLIFHPGKGLSVGASFYKGKYTLPDTPTPKDKRNRIGAEFAYVYNCLALKGEYISGNDGSIKKDGWYLQAGYCLIPKKIQGILKYDNYDPNTKISKNATDVYTIGVNWHFNDRAKLQINYELKDEEGQEKSNNSLIIQMQLGF